MSLNASTAINKTSLQSSTAMLTPVLALGALNWHMKQSVVFNSSPYDVIHKTRWKSGVPLSSEDDQAMATDNIYRQCRKVWTHGL